jgi:nucleoside-diphosphate-sugar epimerase
MEIIGGGFLAGHFQRLADRHPDVTLIAAGPSSLQITDHEVFARETNMVSAILDDCRRRDRTAVLFSSASHAIYGHTTRPATEADPCPLASTFGRHKLDLEAMTAASGARWLVIRLSHAVGEGQRPHQFFPAMARGVREGHVRVFLNCYRDLLDVSDAVRALDALLTAGVAKEVVNVATGSPYPVETLVDRLGRHFGVEPAKELVDAPPSRTLVSVAKLRQMIPDTTWPSADDAYLDRLITRYARHYA